MFQKTHDGGFEMGLKRTQVAPLISIITVCYNSANTIERTIKSVLTQDYPQLEYIIIDGASKDRTLDIINSYRPHIAQAISEPDRGLYHAMNKGIGLARGSVIGILNSDDSYADCRVVSRVMDFLERTSVDACYGNLSYFESKFGLKRKWRAGSYNPYKYYLGWMPPHPTFFIKKNIYEKYGLFDESFKITADYEIMLRFLLKNKVSVGYLDDWLVTMSPGGISNRGLVGVVKANIEVIRAWRKNRLTAGCLVPFLKPLQKIVQFL